MATVLGNKSETRRIEIGLDSAAFLLEQIKSRVEHLQKVVNAFRSFHSSPKQYDDFYHFSDDNVVQQEVEDSCLEIGSFEKAQVLLECSENAYKALRVAVLGLEA